MTALWSLTATELAEGYRAGAFTPADALSSVEARLDAVNPHINAVVAENREAAHRQAAASGERWRAGAPLSVVDGVPMTIKDNLLAAGLPATWGSAAHAGFVPKTDEAPIARLRAAGAVFLGKSNVPEFTLQGYTSNLLFGKTRNPHAPDKTPGGSTGGGAAAVAAGIGPVAIGTDGGGSLRRPAAHCGLYAFKPSVGQIARYGGFPEILSDFEVVGPIARTARDLRSFFSVLKGYDPVAPSSLAARADTGPFPPRCRIAYLPWIGKAPVDPLIARATDDFAVALSASGHAVEMIETPYDAESVGQAWGLIASSGLHWHLKTVGSPDGLGENARSVAAAGAVHSGADYAGAIAAAHAARQEAARFFLRYDLLLTPSIAALAWPAAEAYPPEIAGEQAGPRGHAVFTGWMNVAGLCAVNVPVGMTPDRGGIGVQLAAAAGRDDALLDFVCNHPAIKASGPAPLSRRFD